MTGPVLLGMEWEPEWGMGGGWGGLLGSPAEVAEA